MIGRNGVVEPTGGSYWHDGGAWGGVEEAAAGLLLYAHEDLRFQQELKKHLSLLIGHGLLEEIWTDREIKPGTKWENVIDEKLRSADIIIFFVSIDFCASEYCLHKEFETALGRKNEAWLLPIYVSPFRYQVTPFGDLEMMYKQGAELLPLEGLRSHTKKRIYAEITEEIEKYFSEIGAQDDAKEGVNRVELASRDAFWKVPSQPMKVFASDDFLDRLHQNLTSNVDVPVVVTGRGGLGKSTIVNAYARAHRDDYPSVFWLAAQDESTLSESCTELAMHLGLPAAQQSEARTAIRKWLSDHPGWLVILDNVIDQLSYDAIESFLPRDGGGRILMTSRAGSVWHGIANEMPLPRRPLDDCVDMLLEWSGEDDRAAAAQLCEIVKRVPREIWRAAQAMRTKDLTIDEYIARLNSKLSTA